MALKTQLNNLVSRYRALPPNDRKALIVLSAFLGCVAIYIVLHISWGYRQAAIDYYKAEYTDLRWMHLNQMLVRQKLGAGKTAGGMANKDTSLVAVASESAKKYSIAFKRFQPDGDDKLSLWLESVPFDALMDWLAVMQKDYAVTVEQFTGSQANESGLVDARVTLVR